MLSSNHTVLRDHLLRCAKDVLESYDMTVDDVEVDTGDLPDPKLAAVIQFDGAGFHGELGLVAPVAVVRSSYPVPSERDTVTDSDVQDWAGELTNQVLGMLKRKLLRSGLDIRTSLPRCLSPVGLPHPDEMGANRCSFHVKANSGSKGLMELWLDTVMPADLDLASTDSTALATLPEGEALLF